MSTENEKELQQLKNRLLELSDKAYMQNIFTFTGFLGLSQQDVFWKNERVMQAGYSLWGGIPNADRKVIRFGNPEELGYEVPFPITCIHIEPLQAKFADPLTHRDFLGALMNLGIDRSTLGDIKVGEKEAYLLCLDSISDYVCENLSRVRHTNVKCTKVENPEELPQEQPQLVTVQVASARIDALIAKITGLSREKSLELFRTGKVFLDGRLCENNARVVKVGETVNARGFGKFRISGEPRRTRKGKLAVEAEVYR